MSNPEQPTGDARDTLEGSYTEVDGEAPHERLRFVLEDSGCRHIITTAGRAQTLPRTAAKPILLDTDRVRGAVEMLLHGGAA